MRGYQMDLDALAARVADDRRAGLRPFMVVATAGTTGAGAIDPLSDLARYCRSQDLWFHVDAAWGGAAVISPRLRTYLQGIEEADSITWDAHKWLSVPMSAGMFFCRHPQAVAEAFRIDTPYMPAQVAEVGSDPYANSVQWSRRFIGLKVFLSLANNGEQGYVEMIDRQARLADKLRILLQQSHWQLMNRTPLPVVCFTREDLNVPHFLQRLYERQIAWMSSVRLAGGPLVLRACITSFHTSESDVEWVMGKINEIARRDLNSGSAMSLTKTILRNVFSNWTGYAVHVIVAFLLTPYILRSLGEGRYGAWALVIGLTGYYGLIDLGISSGISQYLTRYLAENNVQRLNGTASTGMVALTVVGLVVFFCSLVIGLNVTGVFQVPADLRREVSLVVIITGLSAGLQFAFFTYSAVLTSIQRFDVSNAIGVVTRLVSAGITVLVLTMGYGLVGLSLALAVANVLDYALRWYAARKLLPF